MNLMTTTNALHPLAEAIGNTLLDSLWQGALIALGLAIALALIGKRRTNLRYAASIAALIALPIWMAVTFTSPSHSIAPTTDSIDRPVIAAPHSPMTNPAGRIRVGALPLPTSPNWQFAVSLAWTIGVILSLFRFLLGWRRLHRLHRSANPVTDPECLRLLAETSDRLGIRIRVRLSSSSQISSPCLSGFLWPAILLPAGLLGGIPASHLQSILAHELAHFRRWDYAVNLLQSLIEALLFYHPAARWISRQIRIEREHACDDLAVSLLGNNRRRYACALGWLEAFRSDGGSCEPALGMVRDPRDTLSRIERLTNRESHQFPIQPGTIARSTGLIWIGLAVSGFIFAAGTRENQPDSPRTGSHPPADETGVFIRCQTGRDQAERTSQLLEADIIWPRRIVGGSEIPLFRSVTLVERNGKLYNLHREKPRLFPQFPNRYLLDHELNFLDRNMPNRDPDGDGFTTLEELQADTLPMQKSSHPPYVSKLQFINRHAQLYRITFAAQPDENRIQLNRLPTARWERKTMIHRLGETSEDGQVRLEKLTGNQLEITFLETGEAYQLEKRKTVEIPTWFAELQLDLPDEAPFFVKLGEIFRLNREPEVSLKLEEVDEHRTLVTGLESKQFWTLDKLKTNQSEK